MSRLILLFVFLFWQCRQAEQPTDKQAIVPAATNSRTIDTTKILQTIAFGSCNQQDRPQPLWTDIQAAQPDLWIWLGDNIYADTDNMDTMRTMYQRTKNHPGYRGLREKAQVIGIWDDHDFGANDAGKEYPMKKESQQLMLDFLDVPSDAPQRKREGAYSSYVFGEAGKKVKIILLDARYFRDALKKNADNHNIPDPEGDVLGAAQWSWLERELKTTGINFWIIGSGIQILPEEHRFEKWANFPAARKRLLDLFSQNSIQNLVMISGDRHMAEISKISLEGLDQPVFEVTSSSLNAPWAADREEPNQYRVGQKYIDINFGVMSIDWEARKVKMEVRRVGNTAAIEAEMSF